MHWINRICCSIAALALLCCITGCSTSNPTLGYIGSVEQNKHLDAASLYKEDLEKKGLDVELYLMEKGRITQLQGDFNASRASFDKQVEILKQRELDDNTLPGAEINTGSVLVNDNMLPYKARLFEVEMLYLSQSFNYLAQGDLEGATVEIRNADFLLNEAEKARTNKDFKEETIRNSESNIQKKLFENQKAIQDNSKAKQPSARNPQTAPGTVSATTTTTTTTMTPPAATAAIPATVPASATTTVTNVTIVPATTTTTVTTTTVPASAVPGTTTATMTTATPALKRPLYLAMSSARACSGQCGAV
jgi:hypothetical protein